jgi:hypothetical protein
MKLRDIQKINFGILFHHKNGTYNIYVTFLLVAAHNSLSLCLPSGCACNLLLPHLAARGMARETRARNDLKNQEHCAFEVACEVLQ